MVAYHVFIATSTNALNPTAALQHFFTTNLTVRILVASGREYYVGVTACSSTGVESLMTVGGPYFAPPLGRLATDGWRFDTRGVYGRTNVIQTSTDLATWTNHLQFVGDGALRTLRCTNTAREFFRVRTP